MIIRGVATKYIMEKPERFNPMTANFLDKFFINGYPHEIFAFSFYNNKYQVIECKQTWNSDKIVYLDYLALNLVKDNPEHLNLTTSIGLEADPNLPIISVAKCLQKYLPMKKCVKVIYKMLPENCKKCLSNCFEVFGCSNRKEFPSKLITGDTGPNDRFVESVDVQDDIITVKGRAFDLPSGIFKWFEPNEKVGSISLEVEI